MPRIRRPGARKDAAITTYATRQAGIRYRLILKAQKESAGAVISASRTLSQPSPKECIGGDTTVFAHGTITQWSKALSYRRFRFDHFPTSLTTTK